MTISRITLGPSRAAKQAARERLAINYEPTLRFSDKRKLIKLIATMPYREVDKKIKSGQDLLFEEAFVGMCYVLAATNKAFFTATEQLFETACGQRGSSDQRLIAIATAFLQGMAVKEALSGLTPEETAGMVVAATIDTTIQLSAPSIIETCGMGGDLGYVKNGDVHKTINVSTLSALVLAALGLPAVKHGSYSNSSAIGSTDSIETFGANVAQDSYEALMHVWDESNFAYLDAHWCKTLHDLSHLLMIETINHLIGPFTPPFDSQTTINKLMGVNEKVHPSIVVKAYNLLHSMGFQKIGGVVVVAGLAPGVDTFDYEDVNALKQHVLLDEISPFGSVISFGYQDNYLGTYRLNPEDYPVQLDPSEIWVVNSREKIARANFEAISGKSKSLASYLALNASLGLFAATCLDKAQAITPSLGPNTQMLAHCYETCLDAIMNGKALEILKKYVEVTGGTFVAG